MSLIFFEKFFQNRRANANNLGFWNIWNEFCEKILIFFFAEFEEFFTHFWILNYKFFIDFSVYNHNSVILQFFDFFRNSFFRIIARNLARTRNNFVTRKNFGLTIKPHNRGNRARMQAKNFSNIFIGCDFSSGNSLEIFENLLFHKFLKLTYFRTIFHWQFWRK